MKNIVKKILQIAVFGSSTIDERIYKLAYEVGKEIAKSGNVLINGGLTGAMEASAKGAKDADGLIIGILPGSDFDEGNEFSTVKILTGMQFARNQITSLSCHGAIVVGGSSGAYEEARRVWEGRGPVVVIKDSGSKTGASSTLIEREGNFGLAFPEQTQKPYHIFVANSPKEAVEKVIDLIEKGYPKKS
ncbi:TIGR00725 family protein [Candidatus Falkowbacteria bacterium]|nr:TIGR00725 family protein [Candidatus Falkowbacteria bacterium]